MKGQGSRERKNSDFLTNAGSGLGRREFLQKSLACSGAAVGGLGMAQAFGFSAGPKRPPNILFLLVDQWRGQAMGYAGDPNIETPHLDQLAASGLRLTQCSANSPLCTPYRAMLMSGRYPARTNVYTNNAPLSPDEYCIADHFGAMGYATGYVGKWHLDGSHRGHVQHRQGWQYFAGFNRGHNYFDGVYWINESTQRHRIPEGSFEPDVQADLAMDWIRQTTQNQPDKPWFMMVSWGGPHGPYIAPDDYMAQFDPTALQSRGNVRCHLEDCNELEDGICPSCDARYRERLHGYYAHAKNLDDNTGRMMAFLKENGLDENTIVVFTSDHGDMHYSHGMEAKGKPWEESINVPFILSWPKGVAQGRVSDSMLSAIDLYPTLCGLAGLPVPPGKDGKDLSAFVRGEGGPEQESVFITRGTSIGDNTWGWRGVRTKRYTYAWYWGQRARDRDFGIWADQQYGVPGDERPLLLYDNQEDPLQLNNLAVDDAYRPLMREMHAMTVEHMRRMDEPMTPLLEGAVI